MKNAPPISCAYAATEFERQKKLNRLLLHSAKAYHNSREEYIKYPVELAANGIKTGNCNPYRTHAAADLLLPGKARISDHPEKTIADATDVHPRTVKRHFKRLIQWNWMGEDERNGWLFFRGLDRIHKIEDLTFGRAAILQKKDLKKFKAFLAGAVFASLAKTREGQRSEHVSTIRSTRSEPPAAPISLSVIEKTLGISTKTAYRLRKLAHEERYIKNETNLIEITNWTPGDLTELKKQDRHILPVELADGSTYEVSIKKIRYEDNKIKLQMPNMVKPLVSLKSRRGLSKYQPSNGSNNDGQVCHWNNQSE